MARLPRAPAERSPRFLGVRAGLAYSAASWDAAAQARSKRHPFFKDRKAAKPSEGACAPCPFSHLDP